jgi:hypothetical protein
MKSSNLGWKRGFDLSNYPILGKILRQFSKNQTCQVHVLVTNRLDLLRLQ